MTFAKETKNGRFYYLIWKLQTIKQLRRGNRSRYKGKLEKLELHKNMKKQNFYLLKHGWSRASKVQTLLLVTCYGDITLLKTRLVEQPTAFAPTLRPCGRLLNSRNFSLHSTSLCQNTFFDQNFLSLDFANT